MNLVKTSSDDSGQLLNKLAMATKAIADDEDHLLRFEPYMRYTREPTREEESLLLEALIKLAPPKPKKEDRPTPQAEADFWKSPEGQDVLYGFWTGTRKIKVVDIGEVKRSEPEKPKELVEEEGVIYAPANIQVLDRPAVSDECFCIGNVGFISPSFFEHSRDYLPMALAWLMGWYNNSVLKGVSNQYLMLAARHTSYPLDVDRLFSVGATGQKWVDTSTVTNVTNASTGLTDTIIKDATPETKFYKDRVIRATGDPDVLRPKPINILTGGGHDFKNFNASDEQRHDLSEETVRDGFRGLLGVKEYLERAGEFLGDFTNNKYSTRDFERIKRSMLTYFGMCKLWEQLLKDAQYQADEFTKKLGQGERLIEFLEKSRMLSGGNRQDTINFYNPLPHRIERLKGQT